MTINFNRITLKLMMFYVNFLLQREKNKNTPDRKNLPQVTSKIQRGKLNEKLFH